MLILDNLASLHAWREQQQQPLAFVPTMGNLHAGHLHLMHAARERAPLVVASIFVNRLQFGAGEDFDRYPRTFERDCQLLREAGVSAVFAPQEQDLYPTAQRFFVEPPAMAELWCGAVRPGHFRGVLTVVGKLFHLVRPQLAVFGKKDYQQLSLIRGMVEDLNFPLQIIGCDTQRADDGLALSSRNGYLTPEQRSEAPRLFRLLQDYKGQLEAGARNFRDLEQSIVQQLRDHGWQPDYIALCRQRDLQQVDDGAEPASAVILAAARLGTTRLIDNIEVCVNNSRGL